MPTLKIFNETEARHLVFHHNMAVPKLDKNIAEASKDETRTRGTRPAAAPPRPPLPLSTTTRTIPSNTTILCPYPAPATSTGQMFGIAPPNPLHNDRKRKKETISREQEDQHQAILIKKQQQEQEQVMMKNKIKKYERLHMMTDSTTTSFCKKSSKKNNEAPPSNNRMSFHAEEAALSRTLVPAAPLAQPHPRVRLHTTRDSDQHQPESISNDEFSTRDFKTIVDEKEPPAGRAPLKAHENTDAENEEARCQQLENILAPISPDTIMMKTRNKLVLKWCPVCYSCEQSCCGEMKKRDEETTNTIIVQSKKTKNEMLENLPPSAAENEILGTSDMIFRAKNNILSMIKNDSNASMNISPPGLLKYNERDRSIMPPPKHRDSSALKENHALITQHVPYRANDVPCIPSEPRVAAHYSRSQPLLAVPPRTTFHPPVPSGSAHTNHNLPGEGYSNDVSQQNGFLRFPSQQGSHYLNCPTPAKPQQGDYSEHRSRLVPHNGDSGNPSAYCYNGPNSRSIAPTSNEIQPSTFYQFALFYPNQGFMY